MERAALLATLARRCASDDVPLRAAQRSDARDAPKKGGRDRERPVPTKKGVMPSA